MKIQSKSTYYIVGAIVVVVVILLVWLVKTKRSSPENAMPSKNDVMQQATSTPSSQSQASAWIGLLQASNAPAKGNLMLVTKDRTIYIRTSRDFSQLLGKNVQVTYQGDLNSFVLGDITLKEQD